jgi:hypothetical protein
MFDHSISEGVQGVSETSVRLSQPRNSQKDLIHLILAERAWTRSHMLNPLEGVEHGLKTMVADVAILDMGTDAVSWAASNRRTG